MAEDDLQFPDGVSPYTYSEMKKYDLPTALYQGTLYPHLDDQYRKQIRLHDERSGEPS